MTMPRERPTNTLKIELDLLQNQNMLTLEQFGKDFSDSIDRLVKAVKDVSGGGLFEGYTGERSDFASDPSDVRKMTLLNSLDYTGGGGGFGGGGFTGGGGYGGGGGVPPGQPSPQASVSGDEPDKQLGWLARRSQEFHNAAYVYRPGTDYGITKYEKAQFGLGMIGQGKIRTLQYASYLAGEHADRNAAGQPMGRMGGFAKITGALARHGIYGEQAIALIKSLPVVGGLTGIGLQGITPGGLQQDLLYGVNVGEYGGGGFLGTGFGSGAATTGVNARYEAWKRSRLGGGNWKKPWTMLLGNPNYSGEMSNEAMQLTNQWGWTGDQQDIALDMMEKYQKRYRGAIKQEQVMQLMDPVLRFGTSSKTSVDIALTSLAEAARAANMNLEQFAQTTLAAAQGVSQATGMTQTQAVGAISAYSMVTGRSPEDAAQLMQDERWKRLAMARYGPYQATEGKYAGTASVEAAMSIIPSNFKDPNLWRELYKPGNESQLQQVRDTLAWYKEAGLLGGMSVHQFENYIKRAGATGIDPVTAMKGSQDLDAALEEGNLSDALVGVRSSMKTMGGQKLLDEFNVAWTMGTGQTTKGTKMSDDIRALYEKDASGDGLTDEEREILRQYERDSGYGGYIEKVLHGKVDTDSDVANLAKRIAGDYWGAAGDTAAAEGENVFTLDVKPPYDNIFKTMMKKGGDKSTSNSNRWFNSPSSGDEESANWRDYANAAKNFATSSSIWDWAGKL